MLVGPSEATRELQAWSPTCVHPEQPICPSRKSPLHELHATPGVPLRRSSAQSPPSTGAAHNASRDDTRTSVSSAEARASRDSHAAIRPCAQLFRRRRSRRNHYNPTWSIPLGLSIAALTTRNSRSPKWTSTLRTETSPPRPGRLLVACPSCPRTTSRKPSVSGESRWRACARSTRTRAEAGTVTATAG